MAEVTTTEYIDPTIAPFSTVSDRVRANSSIPFGLMSHVSEFTAPAVGSGDTGKLIIRLRVPSNYWCQLEGFHVNQRATATPQWDTGIFSTFYTGQNSLSPDYQVQELDFPLAVTGTASIGTNQYVNVGISNDGAQSAYQVNSPVNFMFKGYPSDSAKVPTIEMYNGTASSSSVLFRIGITWKLYDTAQMNHPWLPSK